MAKTQIRLDETLKQKLLDPMNVPDHVMIDSRKYEFHAPGGAGVSGVVWKTRDEHARDRAVKLAIPQHYDQRSYLEELNRAGRLENYPEFARLQDAGLTEIELKDGTKEKFIAFVEEWVEGFTFETLLKDHAELHTTAVFRAFVNSFTSILAILDAQNLRHDDLNAKNIMVVRPRKGEFEATYSLKIIDLASLKDSEKPTRKPKDDHGWVVEHLVSLWNAILRRKQLSVRDRRYLGEAETLLRSMLDEDPNIRLVEPSQIRLQFEEAYTRSQNPKRSELDTLKDPFDFISAEHISDDRLLVRLFARSCPWLEKVTGPDPCLLTGPRGCGKSMLFRWLSLKAQLTAKLEATGDKLDFLAISGFYMSCTADMQNRFAWIKTPALAARFETEIVHYFNLLAAREVIQTLLLMARRSDHETFWGLGPSQIDQIHAFVINTCGEANPRRLQGVSLLDQSLDVIEANIFDTHAGLAQRRKTSGATSASFLGDLTSLLAKQIPILSKKRIAFLVDDFSIHRIPRDVQIVLNRVIWDRRSSHVFKLSSEKYGTSFDSPEHATAEIAREMIEIDCGQEFIALDDADKQKEAVLFAKELLDNRLREAAYHGTAETLIGQSAWQEGSLGRALRKKPKGRNNDQYHGLSCIAQMCSGDVSSLLLIYRAIFAEGSISKNSTLRVSKQNQHKAIRNVSLRMFERIRTYHPYGPEMYEIVNRFGSLVRQILEHGREIVEGATTVPPQCPRIEIDQVAGAVSDELSGEAKAIATELVRRAIFIEMEPGLSRHGNVTSFRWQLRRIFLPVFNTSLAKNDAIKNKTDWLKYFLTNPREACEQEWAKRPKKHQDGGLFPEHSDDEVTQN